jgi:hypothetical protein
VAIRIRDQGFFMMSPPIHQATGPARGSGRPCDFGYAMVVVTSILPCTAFE